MEHLHISSFHSYLVMPSLYINISIVSLFNLSGKKWKQIVCLLYKIKKKTTNNYLAYKLFKIDIYYDFFFSKLNFHISTRNSKGNS